MSASSAPLIQIVGVTKDYGGSTPLVIAEFSCDAGDRVSVSGLDAASAETFVHLVTGAALPDRGEVRTAGRDTRSISTDAEWLTSLDRFGLVTHRALLVDGLSVAANLALPLTLSVDPMTPETRAAVETLAAEVGLAPARLAASTGALSPVERVLLHLARAVVHGPDLIILEDPTAGLADSHASRDVGQALQRMATARHTGWLALTNDDSFMTATGGARLRLDMATGRVSRPSRWRTLWRT